MNIRALAAKLILQVIQQRKSLSEVLKNSKNTINDFSLLQELCYGSIRWYHQLLFIANTLLKKKLKTKDADILILIIVGLYQLKFTNIPDFAAVAETVAATTSLKKPWAKGLINALLRKFISNQTSIDQQVLGDDIAQYSHPEWLIKTFQQDYPSQWQDTLDANNQKAPLFLRINHQLTTVADFSSLLNKNNIAFSIIEKPPTAIAIKNPTPVSKIPGFSDGLCSVQDTSGQQIASALQLKPKQTILDACAAPGSKTCHILEAQPQLDHLIAVDINKARCQMIKENTARLNLNKNKNFSIITADVNQTQDWWDKKLFDRILIDAPCSGTGVIRRHPDIKILKRAADIAGFVTQQHKLLNSLWPLLKPKGILVYSTCSVLKCENELQIANFIKQHPDAKCVDQKQLLPRTNDGDGFYFASITKI
jgi:16S rRNA (cytosine967-C5)-methyltransferase